MSTVGRLPQQPWPNLHPKSACIPPRGLAGGPPAPAPRLYDPTQRLEPFAQSPEALRAHFAFCSPTMALCGRSGGCFYRENPPESPAELEAIEQMAQMEVLGHVYTTRGPGGHSNGTIRLQKG